MSSIKPIKKLPTEPAIHFNYLIDILKEAGLDPYSLKKEYRSSSFQDFCFEKCSKDKITYPNIVDSKGWGDQTDTRYEKFIFGESITTIPRKYDSSGDVEQFNKDKKKYFDTMMEYSLTLYSDQEKRDNFLENLTKHTKFGIENYEWINESLEIIYNKLSQFYVNDTLRVWFPKDRDYDPWVGYDHPHKYNVVSDLDRPNGVYYLSDIENYIEDKYGIKDDLFYKFIIENNYIEGRYWERVWSLQVEETGKLQKENFGNYGMEPTENITHILNIIEKDFSSDIKETEYEGFPIYIDYYKKIPTKF